MYRHHQQDADAAAQQHQYQLNPDGSPFTYSPYPLLDQSLHRIPQHLSPTARTSNVRQSRHGRQSSAGSKGTMGPPGNSNPSSNPNRSTSAEESSPFTPLDRHLPPPEVSEDTITDAYEAFILYCNPNFPLDVDTTTLRTNFETPPKSDNKDFEIFKLFRLIRRFDNKDIKTWGQLALDLGVEAPDASKGQSPQKVQQYTVRLKRWMRSMHVDAFFEYLNGKQHVYFTEVPHPNNPYLPVGRDGVVAEEDLAIRALDPSFKPKRGRRRNSEIEQEDAEAETARKQPRIEGVQGNDLPSANPFTATPFSAHPGQADPWPISAVTPWPTKRGAPQSAISSSATHLQWPMQHNSATPHPMTAQPTSMNAHINAAFDAEPKSAITPSTRKRRKHGPAVSSAWPSTSAPGAKARGRPPASRNVQDGPFSTFPAAPSNETPKAAPQSATVAVTDSPLPLGAEDYSPHPSHRSTRGSESSTRPGRLSLQVPQRPSGNVRLATPPRVLVNGETDSSSGTRPPKTTDPALTAPSPPRPATTNVHPPSAPTLPFPPLHRALASLLLRAPLTGRPTRLSGDEAKRLAHAVLQRFNIAPDPAPAASSTDARAETSADTARLAAASWLGLSEALGVSLGPGAAGRGMRVRVGRWGRDAEGFEFELGDGEATGEGDPDAEVRELFDLDWSVLMGGVEGAFALQGVEMAGPGVEGAQEEVLDRHDTLLGIATDGVRRAGIDEARIKRARGEVGKGSAEWMGDGGGRSGGKGRGGEDDVDWKGMFQAMEFSARLAKGEVGRVKERMLERILDVLL